MKNPPIKIHPALRPILMGLLLFVIFNTMLTAGVTFSPLNKRFNFSYGNFLPTKLEMLRHHDPQKLDVLFMGTSQTNNGFITKVFENGLSKASGRPINSFNLGLPNNRYDVMLGYLQFHLHKFGKPKLVLVELSPSIQERSSYFYYLPALYYRSLIENDPSLTPTYINNPLISDNVKQELLFSSMSSLHQYRFTFSPINLISKVGSKLKSIGFHDASANAAEMDFEGVAAAQQPTQNIDPGWTEKGWYPKEQSPHMTSPDGVRLSVEEARKYYIDHQTEVNFDKLSALLAYCKQQNIPVVLVSWPNHPAFLKVFRQSALSRQYEAGLNQMLGKNPVPVINLNNEIPASQPVDNGGFFADPRHLTPDGARLFSEKLAGDLVRLPAAQTLFSR